jgi:hypothetical protein
MFVREAEDTLCKNLHARPSSYTINMHTLQQNGEGKIQEILHFGSVCDAEVWKSHESTIKEGKRSYS